MPVNLSLFNSALRFAAQVHRTQLRKGSTVPYITHPLAVALIVARVSASDEAVAAGILHDTIEDCQPYGSITKDLIAAKFGDAVATIVSDLSEEDKTLPWLERKKAALEHIPHMSHDSLLVKSADVLHNLTCLLDDIDSQGVQVLGKFNASREDTITRYQLLLAALEKAWPENPLLEDLRVGVGRLVEVAGRS